MSGRGAANHDWRRWRRRTYELLDPTLETPWDRIVHHGLIALVLINVIAVILDSVPSISARYQRTASLRSGRRMQQRASERAPDRVGDASFAKPKRPGRSRRSPAGGR